MEIGEWRATRDLNALYRETRALRIMGIPGDAQISQPGN
jgi:hypothetical protein